MSYSQEVYDATRSRISPIDSSTVERVARECFDISYAKAMLQDEIARTAMEMQRPSVLFRLEPFVDGNMYCVLLGENLHEGVAGFGETVDAAMRDFDVNYYRMKAPRPRKRLKREPARRNGSTRSVKARSERMRHDPLHLSIQQALLMGRATANPRSALTPDTLRPCPAYAERRAFQTIVQEVAVMEWQPIETAPKDGTRFAVITPRSAFRFSETWRVGSCYWERGLKEPRFIYDNWQTADHPTHWMPLPPPPKEQP